MAWNAVYSEDFESFSIGASLLGVAANEWTDRGTWGAPTFIVVAGKWASINGTDWGCATPNDPDVAAFGDGRLRFQVKATASGRWIFSPCMTATGSVWIQCLPGVQLRVFTGTTWDFITGQALVQDWDAAAAAIGSACSVIVERSGNDFTLTIDGTLIGTVTIPGAPASGMPGVSTWQAGWQFDDFVAEVAVAPTISGLSVVNITPTGATVTWTTDSASSSRVDYGTTTAYGNTISDAAAVTSHAMAITGLAPGTTYHYRVSSTDAQGTTTTADYVFTTALASNKYGGVLRALFPRGRAWSRDSGGMPAMVLGASQELERADEKIVSMLNEMDTRHADELLGEHEADLGLSPSATATMEQRRDAANAQLIMMGGQDPAYFIRIAEAMGYVITIDQFRPAWCGIFRVGEPCGNQDNLFVWRVNVAYNRESPDPTGADLYAVLTKIKPAHTELIFRMASPGFTRGFSSGFDARPKLTDAELAVGGFRWKGFSKGFDLKYGGGFKYGSFTRGFNNLK